MRGKASPTPPVFESPYSTTILPAQDSARPAKGGAKATSPEPTADATAYVPTHGGLSHAAVAPPIVAPEAAPVAAPPAAAPTPLYAPPVYEAPAYQAPAVGYPSASYQPTYQPAPYQPAAYPPPTNPPSSYQPNRFEPQGYAAPGYQVQQGPAQPFQNYPAPSGRSTGAKVLIALAIGVVGFVVIGILAAIAIPVFLSQREKPANRNVVLPSVLLDQPRLTQADADGSVAAEVANLQRSSPGMTQTQAAFYGTAGQPIFLVVAGKLARQPTPADKKSFFRINATEGDLTLQPEGSGPFGGSMECGQETTGGQAFMACESLDSAAAVVVVASNTTPSQLAVLTRQIIGTIEQKG